MAAIEKSENQGRLSLKSCKLVNDNTLYLTHVNGVDSYEVSDISEIEIKHSNKYFQKPNFVWEYFFFGLVGIIVIPLVAAFFDRFPNKDYIEEFLMYFSFSFFLVFLFFLTPIGSFILELLSGGILAKTYNIGRELNVYSLSQGRKEYHIDKKEFDEVMTNDFFEILFEKSTGVNKIFNKNNSVNSISLFYEFRKRTETINFWKSEFWGHTILFFLSIVISIIYFFAVHFKGALIPLFIVNIILLIIELFGMIDSRKMIRRSKKSSLHCHRANIKNNEAELLHVSMSRVEYFGKIENSEIITGADCLYVNGYEIYQDFSSYEHSDYSLLTLRGMAYFLKQKKNKELWIVIFKQE